MRILIRTSKWAIWSRRLGALAVPLIVLGVLMHRARLLDGTSFLIIETIALALALGALIAGIGAYIRLWITGDRGWGRATLGILTALLCLAPFAYLGAQALRYPALSEVSTNFDEPVALVAAAPPVAVSAADREALGRRFPNAKTRTYPISATQVFGVVDALVADKDWEVLDRVPPPSDLEDGTIAAHATTLFGWEDAVAIRVRGTASGAVVDMRSAPVEPFLDFGSNGNRIEGFLADLDDKLTQLVRNTPPAGDEAEPATDAGN